VFIQKIAGGTVTAGRKSALYRSLSRHLASSARGFPSIVCVLAAFGASTALAQSPVVTTNPPGADRGAVVAYGAQAHDALIVARRAGRITPAQALQQLKDWLAAPPGTLGDTERQRVVSDAIAIAAGDSQFAEAVALGRQHTPAKLSDYALGPLALAARRTHDTALQGETIGVWRARQPAAREPRIHEAFWRLDSGDVAGAKTLSTVLSREPARQVEDRVALLELRAAVARADGQPLQALAAYTEAGALRPERRDIRREADFLLADNGAASTAFEDAEATERAHPGSFSPLALSVLQQKALAQRLRWAIEERDQRLGPARVVALDKVLADQDIALARLDAAALQAQTTGNADADAWRTLRVNLQSDRLLALVERGRPADAIALYDSLRAAGTDLPFYGLAAAARAFAQERRSVDAVPLYEAAVAKGGADLPMPDEIYFGLVYAYQDTGRFEEAEALLTRLEEHTPALMRLTPEAGRPNGQYTDVSGMRALMQLYTDRPAAAQQRFATLTQEAPLNAGYAFGAALTERLREHPEAALARFEAQAADQPYDTSARVGHVEALLDAGWFGDARRAPNRWWPTPATPSRCATWNASGAPSPARGSTSTPRPPVRRGHRQPRVAHRQLAQLGPHQRRMARVLRPVAGPRQHRHRQRELGPRRPGPQLAARPLAGRGRAAARQRRPLPQQRGRAPGLPRQRRLAALGHLRRRQQGTAVEGARGRHRRARDRRERRLRGERGAPLRPAAAAAGLQRRQRARRPRPGLARALDQHAALPAGNETRRRHRPRPRAGRALLQPVERRQRAAHVRAQWLNWKSDDRQFFQAVELGGGSYRQAGFGSGPLWSLRYEHRWNLGQKLTLRYGLSISSHPYDGVRERQRGVFLNLSMPLQ
jgi:hypothetical protein